MRSTALPTRREALATLPTGALATRTALSAEAPFRFGALDHLAGPAQALLAVRLPVAVGQGPDLGGQRSC